MHAISSYRGNRPTNTHSHTHTHTHTNRQDRLQYTAPQLGRSVTSGVIRRPLTEITDLHCRCYIPARVRRWWVHRVHVPLQTTAPACLRWLSTGASPHSAQLQSTPTHTIWFFEAVLVDFKLNSHRENHRSFGPHVSVPIWNIHASHRSVFDINNH